MKKNKKSKKKKKSFKRDILHYIIIIILVIVVRSFIITPIRVEQKSMNPTLKHNDIMMLNKIGLKLNDINRFDVVVLNVQDEYLIKRVVGLPGEYIEYKDNKLFVNDKVVEENFTRTNTGDFVLEVIGYDIIPENKYFVIGDNRGNSTDSRIFGLINEEDIIGKTNIVIFPFKNFGIIK